MKLAEILNSVPTFITNDEASLANRIKHEGKVNKKDLTEQDLVIADTLVNKNVLKRRRNGKEVYFVRNDDKQDNQPITD